jgi:hypothetical protein
MPEALQKKLKAITRATRFLVRLVDEAEIEILKRIGNDVWCTHAGRQVTWSKRDSGQWVIFVL